MSNVIRPTFGSRPKPDAASPVTAAATEHQALRIFGQAGGYTVALIHDEDDRAGPVLKVVVGPMTGNEVEAVAVLPSTSEGNADADMVGMAILRTLEVIETGGRDGPDIA